MTQESPHPMTTPVKTIEVLRRARVWLESDATWTRHAYARTDDGCDVSVTSNRAACFCLDGAKLRACHEVLGKLPPGMQMLRLNRALDEFAKRRGFYDRFQANDSVGGGRLVALAILDDAIAELESQESRP